MISQSSVHLLLIACLLLGLLAYHFMEKLISNPTKWYDPAKWSGFLKIAQISVTSILFLFSLHWEPLTKLILQKNYIAGSYSGIFENFDKKTDSPYPSGKIEFTIHQSIFETTVDGTAYKPDGSILSTLNGRLFSIEGNRYSFGIGLLAKMAEYGVILLTINQNHADGFYYSGEPGYPTSITVSVDRKEP